MVDIAIIGAGTAGMTSALYALRNGKSVVIIEHNGFGGQIANSPRVENFPSIQSISGIEFSDNLFTQIVDLGAQVELDDVLGVEKLGKYFHVKLPNKVIEAKSVVLATGVKHRNLNIPHEAELTGKGVSYCAVCDGPFYKGEDVVLVGDGNSALQYAILLSGYCRQVYMCTLTDKFFGDSKLVEIVRSKLNVKIIPNVSVTGVIGDDEVRAVELTKHIDKSRHTLNVKALFIAIGQLPDNARFNNIVDLDASGYIMADESCATRTAGVFAAGDCRTKKIRQLTTAVADGAVSALGACNYVDSL